MEKDIFFFSSTDKLFCKFCSEITSSARFTDFLAAENVGLELLKINIETIHYRVVDERRYVFAVLQGRIGDICYTR